MERIALLAFVFAIILSLFSCDPGLNGNLRIVNQTDTVLTVVTRDWKGNDTTVIEPGSNGVVSKLGGLGSNRDFDCCPCLLDSIQVFRVNGPIRKDANNKDNWSVPNKSKLKKFGGEEVKCEFYVTPADL